MNEREYLKMAEGNFEQALKILIATSTDECVDLWELQIRDYVKVLKGLTQVNDMISGGSTITIKEENIQNQ